jgi:Ribbon-helix-helix protein, copG family
LIKQSVLIKQPVSIALSPLVSTPAKLSHHELHSEQMRNTISVRLPEELAEWLESTAAKAGVSQGKVIRDQLEKARTHGRPAIPPPSWKSIWQRQPVIAQGLFEELKAIADADFGAWPTSSDFAKSSAPIAASFHTVGKSSRNSSRVWPPPK